MLLDYHSVNEDNKNQINSIQEDVMAINNSMNVMTSRSHQVETENIDLITSLKGLKKLLPNYQVDEIDTNSCNLSIA